MMDKVERMASAITKHGMPIVVAGVYVILSLAAFTYLGSKIINALEYQTEASQKILVFLGNSNKESIAYYKKEINPDQTRDIVTLIYYSTSHRLMLEICEIQKNNFIVDTSGTKKKIRSVVENEYIRRVEILNKFAKEGVGLNIFMDAKDDNVIFDICCGAIYNKRWSPTQLQKDLDREFYKIGQDLTFKILRNG